MNAKFIELQILVHVLPTFQLLSGLTFLIPVHENNKKYYYLDIRFIHQMENGGKLSHRRIRERKSVGNIS